ncbi:type VI secretion system contractile sheath small subunit [Paraburkholderia sp. SARCC-3016]|jgi:type VI secretion system protein ImpB|uniref:type VI secretion system contractile sheath small subunit n=1 Tax=Paraburkholderia sp. SARCC-3016 TaxID=3058611 RepID=UPI00280A1D1D|nr:type VI secretion system contractile sheath small subunit [Paraburkholderia sp. SARCC-3016]MDQ7977248.1 type VI secretion system contractile sheath small subunit [Paraburkholderia sp. SARCC-3016]
MSANFQNEVPKARINLKLDLHTGGAQQKVELPLKLLVMGDYGNGRDTRSLAERTRVDINRNNFNAVLAQYRPKARIAVENTMAGNGSELPVELEFLSMDDFKPDVVARKVPELRALMAARNLLRDLKYNLLDNAAFRRELEKILKNPDLSERLRIDLKKIGESEPNAALHCSQ